MKFFFVIITFFITLVNLFSQGFDWQYSSRLPFKTPKFYFGINANYGIISSKGKVKFLENQIPCPDFNDAAGKKYSIGINAEYWNYNSQYAYTALINYNANFLNYISEDFVPLSPSITAHYEETLSLNYTTLSGNFGVKYRIANSHFHIAGSAKLDILLLNKFDVTERIKNPPEEVPPFRTNPASYVRTVLDGEINDIKQYYITPNFSIGYDISLGLGIYATPTISIEIPIMSSMKHDDVKNIIYYFGLFINSNFLR